MASRVIKNLKINSKKQLRIQLISPGTRIKMLQVNQEQFIKKNEQQCKHFNISIEELYTTVDGFYSALKYKKNV